MSNPTENGLLEGISSLHSWIKSQTMIKPVGREKDPNSGVVRTNYNNDEVKVTEIISTVNLTVLKWYRLRFNFFNKVDITFKEYEDDEVIIRLTTVDPQARLEERVEFSHTSGRFHRMIIPHQKL